MEYCGQPSAISFFLDNKTATYFANTFVTPFHQMFKVECVCDWALEHFSNMLKNISRIKKIIASNSVSFDIDKDKDVNDYTLTRLNKIIKMFYNRTDMKDKNDDWVYKYDIDSLLSFVNTYNELYIHLKERDYMYFKIVLNDPGDTFKHKIQNQIFMFLDKMYKLKGNKYITDKWFETREIILSVKDKNVDTIDNIEELNKKISSFFVNLKDNFKMNVSEFLNEYDCTNDEIIKSHERIRVRDRKGKAVGKTQKQHFALIQDENIKFNTHADCYQFLIEHNAFISNNKSIDVPNININLEDTGSFIEMWNLCNADEIKTEEQNKLERCSDEIKSEDKDQFNAMFGDMPVSQPELPEFFNKSDILLEEHIDFCSLATYIKNGKWKIFFKKLKS